MKTENSLCIHEPSSPLLVSCKYLYKHNSPAEDFAEPEGSFLGGIPLREQQRAATMPCDTGYSS